MLLPSSRPPALLPPPYSQNPETKTVRVGRTAGQVWAATIKALAGVFSDIYALDLPGHGLSSLPGRRSVDADSARVLDRPRLADGRR